MSKRIQDAIDRIAGTRPKSEELKAKQRRLLEKLKSEMSLQPPIDSKSDSAAASKPKPSTSVPSSAPKLTDLQHLPADPAAGALERMLARKERE